MSYRHIADDEVIVAVARKLAEVDGHDSLSWMRMDAYMADNDPARWIGLRATYAQRALDILKLPELRARLTSLPPD